MRTASHPLDPDRDDGIADALIARIDWVSLPAVDVPGERRAASRREVVVDGRTLRRERFPSGYLSGWERGPVALRVLQGPVTVRVAGALPVLVERGTSLRLPAGLPKQISTLQWADAVIEIGR